MSFEDFSRNDWIKVRGVSDIFLLSSFLNFADVGDNPQSIVDHLVVEAAHTAKFLRFQIFQKRQNLFRQMQSVLVQMPKQVNVNFIH